jgi:hypothetical protein
MGRYDRRYSLPYRNFCQFMQVAPVTLRQLLGEQLGHADETLCKQLVAYYARLTYGDHADLYHSHALPLERLRCLLEESGLDPAFSELPQELHRRYRAHLEEHYREHGSYTLSEEETLFELSREGRIPPECTVLISDGQEGWIWEYDPLSGTLNDWWGCEVEDTVRSCLDYLRRKGIVFPSEEAVIRHALERGWPNAEKAAEKYGIHLKGKEACGPVPDDKGS